MAISSEGMGSFSFSSPHLRVVGKSLNSYNIVVSPIPSTAFRNVDT